MHLLSDSRFAHHLWIRLAIPSLAAWLWCFCATVPTNGQPPATAEETTPGNDSGLLSSSPKKKGAEDSETGTTRGNQEGRSPLRFRRWFAPIEKIEDWPWGDSRYRPVLREQFETWIASTPSQAWSHLPSEVVVESIQLDATYKEQQFLEGKGRMRIELRSDQPAILFLEPLSMAIDRLRWSNGEEADAGMFRRGDFGVLCPSNGTLLFDWTLNRQEFGDENVSRFSLQMPPSPLIHLNLTLPATIEPTLSEGLILQPENTQKGKRWPISLGGHHQTVLRLKKNPSRASTPLPAIGMRQSITYDLSVQGVEVKSRFHFDKLQPSLFDEVLIELDRALHPISVEYGQTSLQWSIVPSSSDEETVRMLVSIPETESTSVKELQVTAFCALTTDQLWSLPRIRLANENVFWQQTKATLVLSSPLVLRSLKPVLAGQVPSNVIPGGHKNQTYELFYHVPDGRVEVEVGNFLPDLTCATGNDVQLRSNEIASRLVADFSVAEGKRHLIEGVIHAEWTIDSIESVPPGNLAEIYWEPRQNEDGKSHKLSILMKEPVTPENPCRLLVSARRLYPDDYKKLQLTDFSPLHFPEVLSGDHLYSLEATPPLRLETSENGNEPPLEKLSPNDPVVQQRFLESTSLHGLILQDTIANVRKHFHLKIDRPSYSSEIVSRVVARNETLFQSFSFRCLPEATQVDRVFVHFHAPSADGEAPSWKWTLGPEQKPLTEIRRLSRADQARMEIPPGGETWEILLTPSRSGPFELHARSNRPLTPPLGIVLASMPGAVSQQGRVTLEIPESLAIRPHGQILTPIPPEPIEPDRFRKTRAAFQYDPLRSPAEDIAMPLEIHSNRIDLPTQRAWIWHLDLHSHFESKGRVVHLAMISLENRGEEFLNITLPEKIPLENVQQVRIDGRRTGWHLAKDKGETNVEFRLPDHRRFLFIEIEFTQQRSPLKSFHRLTPSFPAFDLPVLNRHWSTWFPKDFRTTSVRSTRSRNDSAAIERSLAEFFFPGMTSRRFHPLKRSSWNELLPFDLQHDRARQIADILASSVGDSEFLNKIASTSKQETTGETAEDPSSQENVSEQVTWGELFVSDAFTEKVLLHPFDESGTSFQLLIDHAALKRIGVFPDTPIPFVRGKSEKIQGLRVLDRAHLSVCIHENTLMITSMNRTAMYSDELLPIMGDHIVKVRDGLLAGEMSETVKDHSQRTYLRATRWAQLEHLERSPWHKQDMMAGFSLETPHWRLLRIDMPETDFEMVIANQKTLYTYWWLAFVGIIILTWRRPLGNPWFLFLVVFASGLCLFFVPLTWKLLLSGICMGACTSLAFWLIRPAPTKSPGPPGRILHRIPIPSASMKQLSPKTFPLVLLHWLIGITFFLLLVLFTVKGAFAQETTSEENPAVSSKEHTLPPYRVFFPVDRDRNPAGPYVYLPESFYHSLTRQVDFAGAGGYHWKIQKARYEGTLSRLPNSETISLESLVATFHLDVSEAQTTIRLPLMPLLPDGARLDGIAVQPVWQGGEETLAFDIREPGEHVLEIQLAPQLISSGARQGFEFTIPEVAIAQLVMNVPVGLDHLNLPSARGAVGQNTEGQLVAALGGTDRLALYWTETLKHAGQISIDVEELFWLRARTGLVDLRAQYRFRISGGSVDTLTLGTDSQLQLSGKFRCDKVPIAKTSFQNGNENTVTLHLEEPVSGNVTVRADYVYKNFSGIGRLRLPKLSVPDVHTIRSWLAVSTDESLNCHAPPSGVGASVFQSVWGDTEETPLFVYDLFTTSYNEWLLSLTTRDPLLEVDQEQILHLDARQTQVHYQADLEIEGECFQTQLSAPASFQVEEARVEKGQTVVESRWIQSPGGKISFFFPNSQTGSLRLIVRGHLTQALDQLVSLPTLSLLDSQIATHQIDVYRDSSVLLTIPEGIENWLPEEAAPVREEAWEGVYLGSFDGNVVSPDRAKMIVRENQPHIDVDQTSLVHRNVNGNRWEFLSEFHLNITEGTLDKILIRLDGSELGAVTTEPQMLVERMSPDILALRPRHPLKSQFRFLLKAPLPNENSISFPKAQLVGADLKRHFIVLPTEDQLRQFWWEIESLIPSKLPPGIPFPGQAVGLLADSIQGDSEKSLVGAVPGGMATFRVAGKDFTALLRAPSSQPRIYQIDVHLHLRRDASCYGIATIDLGSFEGNQCILHLPKQYELLHVAIGGIEAFPEPLSDTQSRIQWTTPRLPQRIEVLFQGQLGIPADFFRGRFTDDDTTFSVPLPSLENMSANQTLWTLSFDAMGPTTFPFQVATTRQIVPPSIIQIDPAIVSTSPSENSSRAGEFHNGFAWRSLATAGGISNLATPFISLLQAGPISTSANSASTASGNGASRWLTPFFPVTTSSSVLHGRRLSQESSDESSSGSPNSPHRANRSTDVMQTIEGPRWGMETSRAPQAMMLCLHLRRMENLLALLDSVTEGQALGHEELRRWYSPWGHRWWELHRETQSFFEHQRTSLSLDRNQAGPLLVEKITPPTISPDRTNEESNFQTALPAEARVQRLEIPSLSKLQGKFDRLQTQQQRMIQQWELESVDEQIRQRPPIHHLGGSLWRMSHLEDGHFLAGVANHTLTSLEITPVSAKRSWLSEKYWSIVWWCIGGIGLAIFLQSSLWKDLSRQFPYFWGVAIGILLWLFLLPGILGWLVVLLTLLSMLRVGWKFRASYSTEPFPGESPASLH